MSENQKKGIPNHGPERSMGRLNMTENIDRNERNAKADKTDGDKSSRRVDSKKVYKKECTVCVHDIPHSIYKALQVIEAAESVCGKNSVIAVVPSEDNTYEITTETQESALKLTNGICIDEKRFGVTFQFSDIVVVSFMNLPAYIEDKDILSKLAQKKCEIKSDVYRHVHPRTQIADGTRYVRVKFPPGLVSLPWSVRFDTGRGSKYFRVVHDNQRQLCNMCGSPFHKYRGCPKLICEGCNEQGHKIKECRAPKCDRCGKLPLKCFCPIVDDGTCPYCQSKSKPCKCVCESCGKSYNDCRCGTVEENDLDDTQSITDENERIENWEKSTRTQVDIHVDSQSNDENPRNVENGHDDNDPKTMERDLVNSDNLKSNESSDLELSDDDESTAKIEDDHVCKQASDGEMEVDIPSGVADKTPEVDGKDDIDCSCLSSDEQVQSQESNIDIAEKVSIGDGKRVRECLGSESDEPDQSQNIKIAKVERECPGSESDELDQSQNSKFTKVERRSRMKFKPNLNDKTVRSRSMSPKIKNVKNGGS